MWPEHERSCRIGIPPVARPLQAKGPGGWLATDVARRSEAERDRLHNRHLHRRNDRRKESDGNDLWNRSDVIDELPERGRTWSGQAPQGDACATVRIAQGIVPEGFRSLAGDGDDPLA